MRVASLLSRFLLLVLAVSLISGCNSNRAPDREKKKVSRFKAERQKTPQFEITMWSKAEIPLVGSNVFGLEFLTLNNERIDPGSVSIQPYLESQGKTPVPGVAVVKVSDTPGVYDVFADLPSEGRWKFTVMAGGQHVFFYYKTRRPEAADLKN